MRFTVGRRIAIGYAIVVPALAAMALIAWQSLGTLQEAVNRHLQKVEALSYVNNAWASFGHAHRTAMRDIASPQPGLRAMADTRLNDIATAEIDLDDLFGGLAMRAATMVEIRQGIGAYREIYREAVADRDAVLEESAGIVRDLETLIEGLEVLVDERAAADDVSIRAPLRRMTNHLEDAADAISELGTDGDASEEAERALTLAADELATLRSDARGALADDVDRIVAAVADAVDRLEPLDAFFGTVLPEQSMRLQASGSAVRTDLSTLSSRLSEDQRRVGTSTLADTERLRNRIVILVGLMMILVIAVSTTISRSILVPLRHLHRAVHDIAEGRPVRTNADRRSDEFGETARSVARIDARGETARRITEAIDDSRVVLVIARAPDAVVHATRAAEELLGAECRMQLNGLIAQIPEIAECFEAERDFIISDSRDGRHFELRARSVVGSDDQVEIVVLQWADRTAARSLQVEIAELLRAVMAGDFSRRLTVTGEGHLADAARALNQMCAAFESGLAAVSGAMAALATGDLTHRMAGSHAGAFEALQSDINKSFATLGEMVSDIHLTTEALARLSRQVSEDAATLSEDADAQAAALQQSSATMEQMSVAVATTSSHSQDVRDLSARAAQQGRAAAAVAEETRAAMGEVEVASKRMQEIISVIDSIAFQTNLLALNAAVEAARAGDSGSGFAVVAAEVRHLAQRSANAAADISALIKESGAHIETGSARVTRTNEALTDISATLDEMNRAMVGISDMAQEQSTSVTEITNSITAMDDATQGQARLAEAGARRAQSLQSSALQLRNHLDHFRLAPRPEAASDGTGGGPDVGKDERDAEPAHDERAAPEGETATHNAVD